MHGQELHTKLIISCIIFLVCGELTFGVWSGWHDKRGSDCQNRYFQQHKQDESQTWVPFPRLGGFELMYSSSTLLDSTYTLLEV